MSLSKQLRIPRLMRIAAEGVLNNPIPLSGNDVQELLNERRGIPRRHNDSRRLTIDGDVQAAKENFFRALKKWYNLHCLMVALELREPEERIIEEHKNAQIQRRRETKKQRAAEDLNERIDNNQQVLDDLMNYHPFATTNLRNGDESDDGDEGDDGDDCEYADIRRTLDELPVPLAMQKTTPTPTPQRTVIHSTPLPSFSSYPPPSAPPYVPPVAHPVAPPPTFAEQFPEAAAFERHNEEAKRAWVAGKQEFGKFAHAHKRK
jgi:hypothetical protein